MKQSNSTKYVVVCKFNSNNIKSNLRLKLYNYSMPVTSLSYLGGLTNFLGEGLKIQKKWKLWPVFSSKQPKWSR